MRNENAGGSPSAQGPLVSVVVRSMDRPSLGATLDSVFQQDWRPLELVVVNATGRPHSALPLPDARIELRLVPEQPTRLGRSAAANLGLDAAQGEAMIFLDDDDLFLPGHLHRLVVALQATPDAVAAYSDVELGCTTPMGWEARHCFAADFDRNRLLFENYLPMNAVLFRRAAVMGADSACRFDERLDLFEDWDFWLQLSERASMVRSPGVSARYVMSEQGGSGVFEASSAAQAARGLLHSKWQQRTTSLAHIEFLCYVQSIFRASADLKEELAEVQRAQQALNETLQARNSEITAHAANAQDLRELVAARETDIRNAGEMIASLQHILAARDTELANVHAAHGAMEGKVAGLEAEMEALQAKVAALHAEGPLTALTRTLKRKMHDHR